MKNLLFVLGMVAGIIVAAPGVFAGHPGHTHGASADATHAAKDAAVGETILVKAKGLVCDFCARALEKKFMKRKEVAALSVDLTNKVVTVGLKKGQTLGDDVVHKLVTDSGYNVEAIERT